MNKWTRGKLTHLELELEVALRWIQRITHHSLTRVREQVFEEAESYAKIFSYYYPDEEE